MEIVQVALKIKRSQVSDDVFLYPMEPENREILHGFLPSHVQSMGPIVDIEDLFEVTVFA
jgi:hypothetical protein